MKNKDCIQKMPMGCNSFVFETLFGNLYFSIQVLDIFIIIIIVIWDNWLSVNAIQLGQKKKKIKYGLQISQGPFLLGL